MKGLVPSQVVEEDLQVFNDKTVEEEKIQPNMEPTHQPADLSSLTTMIANLTTTVNSIRMDLDDLKHSKLDFTDAQNKQERLIQMESARKEDTLKIKMLSVIVIRQDARIEQLEQEITVIKKKARKANITISGIPEVVTRPGPKEQKSQAVFKEKMQIEQDVEVKKATRLGKGFERPLLVSLNMLKIKEQFFLMCPILKGRKHQKKALLRQ